MRRLILSAQLGCKRSMTTIVDLKKHTSPASIKPLAEFYRNTWPDPTPGPQVPKVELPTRTIPENVLKFKFRLSLEHGSSIFFPHLKTNPADRKVTLEVLFIFNNSFEMN